MLKIIITRLLKHRHPWRELSFSQLAELYSAVSLRQLAQSLVGLFIPVYLYKIGFSVPDVLLFFVMVFAVSALTTLPVGYLVARIGPKHTLLLSNFTQVGALLLLVSMPAHNWPLVFPAAVYGLALKLYFLPYHVDFSKILHPDHGGKELGFMYSMRKLAALVAPFVGGLIALLFGVRYTLFVGVALFVLAALPLFASGEPVVKRQKLDFRGLLDRARWPDYVSFIGFSAQLKVGIVIWPLFLALTVFHSNTYFQLGIVSSFGAVASLFAAFAAGRLVDKSRGGQLLKFSVLTATVVHFLRVLITSFGGAVVTSMAAQSTSCTNTISYNRGFYDQADSLPGQRIAYITVMEAFSEFGNTAIVLIAYGFSTFLLPGLALKASFVVGAGFLLLMLVQRFPALAQQHFSLKTLLSK